MGEGGLMPHSQYIPSESPSFWDRILAQPFIIVYMIVSAIASILTTLSLVPGIVVSRSLENLPGLVVGILGAGLLYGSATCLRGQIFPRKTWSRADAMKTSAGGCFALSLTWFAFALSILFSGNTFGTVTIVVFLGTSACFGLTVISLWLSASRIEARAELESREEQEG